MKNGGSEGLEPCVGVEKPTKTSQAEEAGIVKRNSSLTSDRETAKLTTSLVSDRKCAELTQHSKKSSPTTCSPDLNSEEGAVLPTGRSRYFTRKRYPVTTTFRVDASSDSDSLDESKTVSRVKKRKQRHVGVDDKAERKKRKSKSNSPTTPPSSKKGVKCRVTTERKTPTKTVPSTGDNEKSVVTSCSSGTSTTSSWLSQYSVGGTGTALYQHLFNGSSYFTVTSPGTHTPPFFYGPTIIGENGMPYSYFWTTPSWNAECQSTPMLMNSPLNSYSGHALYGLGAPAKGLANNSKGQWQTQSTVKQDFMPHFGLPGVSASPLNSSSQNKTSKTIVL